MTEALDYPFLVKGMVDDAEASSEKVTNDKELTAALKLAGTRGKSIRIEPESCDFTKENFADKPDLAAMEAGDTEEEEFCENCGKQMVLKNGPWGPFMSCPDYSADPPCKTVRRLNQKVQSKPPEPTGEPCPECGMELVKRNGSYGEFVSCSGYPKCKYVKQTLLDVPCPKDGGKIAERKSKMGNIFYGCTNYPKCDFTSNLKLIAKPCPEGKQHLPARSAKQGRRHRPRGVPPQPRSAAEAPSEKGLQRLRSRWSIQSSATTTTPPACRFRQRSQSKFRFCGNRTPAAGSWRCPHRVRPAGVRQCRRSGCRPGTKYVHVVRPQVRRRRPTARADDSLPRSGARHPC